MTSGVAGAAGISGIAFAARVAGRHGLIPPDSGGIYGCGHTLTYAAQRLLTRNSNAREFERSQISQMPHPKGHPPKGEEFPRLQAGGFKDWRLKVEGLVTRPGSFSIAELKTHPPQSQITQLICEEGWSYIAEWTGVQLSHILTNIAGVQPKARFVVYHSMDGWLDAIDLDEALHAQTLVTYRLNDSDLPVGHGGPLRLRLPKQLGYKSLKFLHKISLTDTLEGVPVVGSYSWYAGI